MRVLMIGVYRDGTGWGQSCIEYALALDTVGVDVVLRPVKLNGAQVQLPQRVLDLEAKSSRGCDVVIQHVLPHLFDYNGRFRKNIGLYATETSHFPACTWGRRINNMDEAWVYNRQSAAASLRSGVTVPVRVVPQPADMTRFQRSYEPLDVLKPFRDNGDFIFYTVGEYVRRKNLAAVTRAFHLEFDPCERVQLVIKASKPGMSPEELYRHIEADSQKTKDGLKLRKGGPDAHKQEIIITDRLTDHGLMRLHAGGDCFVMPSHGEAWCMPGFDAMAMGRTPIVTRCSGFLDYVDDSCGWLVDGHEEPVFGVMDTFEDLFTGDETWTAVDVLHLRRCMREAFTNRDLHGRKSQRGIEKAYEYSHASVGMKMLKGLHGAAS